MFANIPVNRLLLYIIIAGFLPVLLVLVYIYSGQDRLNSLESSIESLQHMAYMREKKQALNMTLRANYRESDHFYIDKNVETLSFLEPEVESLQKIISNKNYADDENVKKRLEFLTGTGNSLSFSEGVVQSSPIFQEVTETLVHPVEVNVNDLQKILSKIEGVDIGAYTPGPSRPQLIILDFKLEKKNINDKNDVFLLNMKLLKREFL